MKHWCLFFNSYSTFGGVEIDHNNVIRSAESLAMNFKLAHEPSVVVEPWLHEWSEKFQGIIQKAKDTLGINLVAWSFENFNQAVANIFQQLHFYLFVSFGVMLLVTIGIRFRRNSITFRPWLGVGIVLVPFLANFSSLGVEIGVNEYINSLMFPGYFFVTGIIQVYCLLRSNFIILD